jgi:hypothetical protein
MNSRFLHSAAKCAAFGRNDGVLGGGVLDGVEGLGCDEIWVVTGFGL